MRKPVLIVALLCAQACSARVDPPCDQPVDADRHRAAIAEAMRHGDSTAVANAIGEARQARGQQLGCPNRPLGNRAEPDLRRPSSQAVWDAYTRAYPDAITRLDLACPFTARGPGALALGGYLARLAGAYPDTSPLRMIADSLVDQQASPATVQAGQPFALGLYGYLLGEPAHSCRIEGVAEQSTMTLCSAAPEACVRYVGGRFAGFRFGITDHVELTNGDLAGDPGGGAFDLGWAGALMIEAALQEPRFDWSTRFHDSAWLAAQWAAAQDPVPNHNYTAKTAWLLAQMYALTGEGGFRNALIDKLDRNLVHALLMDLNDDGIVDESNPPVLFADLTPAAQTPGRSWDGHNALPWYHSMVANALVEAYVALRDREDPLAAKYRPYAIAAVDNLAYELIHLGIPLESGVAWTDIPYSLLIALWKIADYEGESRPIWEDAAWAIWNAGVLTQGAGIRGGVNLPVYVLLAHKVRYVPLEIRASRRAKYRLD